MTDEYSNPPKWTIRVEFERPGDTPDFHGHVIFVQVLRAPNEAIALIGAGRMTSMVAAAEWGVTDVTIERIEQ